MGVFIVYFDGVVEYIGMYLNVSQIVNVYCVLFGVRVRSIGGVVDLFYSGIVVNVLVKNDSVIVLNMFINENYILDNNVVYDYLGNVNNGIFINVIVGDSVRYIK